MLCLFDLDGTLIDSEEGIFDGVRHSLAAVGAPIIDDTALRAWVGPPLRHSFGQVLDGDVERVEAAVAAYGQRFKEAGWSRYKVYPDIPETVAALAAAGHTLAIVTSKVRPHAEPIAAHLPFGHLFSRLYAPGPETARSEKADMIAAALADFGSAPADAVMIGDRRYDIEGAVENHVRGIGVLWGFGDREELETAGASSIASKPSELEQLVRG
ncbi:phosphoglycolate phosphatase [Luteibacter rhizovicinus]|uniref:Phosphoglycolate phosphatase n=1 Tax=Luteibacter rhizovicinus TaxID=242606 RepID=A0A4R3YS20_9GAMM|nr:HAD hydrolase-like protein [Luteibacter rhizovicinus]TCV95785.1 phosphoglycolate phosphatase [Luteibacter rhizovicinus]